MRTVGVVMMLGAWMATVALAQDSGPAGSLAGRVVGADDASPLGEALVILAPMTTEGVRPELTDEQLLAVPSVRTASTGDDGTYGFDGVRPGTYALRVVRLGYHPATVEVRYSPSDRARVSVALEVDPIRLDPVFVDAGSNAAGSPAAGILVPTGRVTAERFRQERELASDLRVVSSADVRESASLGERDIFRSMHRMAGVSTRDDYSAELWTRGASWGETRVYLDGIPLFNPLHGFGMFSGLTYQGLGTALFHPGVRAPTQPESGAAMLELQSRSGMESRERESGAEISLASAHLWSRAPLQGGAGGWSVAARRSYVDVVADAVGDPSKPDERLPFAFTDALARLDLRLADDVALQVSTLWESDDITGEIPDVLQGTTASWGNLTGQATVAFPLGDLRAHQTLGGTVYRARVRSIESRLDSLYGAPHEPPTDHDVGYLALRGGVESRSRRWRAGYDLVHQRALYDGPQPWPFETERPLTLTDVVWEDGRTAMSIWGRRRFEPTDRLEVDVGARGEVGLAGSGGGVELQPSLQARYRLTSRASVTAATGRYVQHAQSPASVGPRGLTASLAAGRLWLLPGETGGPLTTRIHTVGAELWLSEAWLLSTTGYLRRSANVRLPDPATGYLVQRAPWVNGSTRAHGVDATLRRLAGRWTGSLGYSWGDARARAAGVEFAAPTDRRHTVDVASVLRVTNSFAIELGYTYATGAPYARVLDRCASDSCTARFFLDAPYTRRSPAYSSLDLVLDFTHRFGGWGLSWFLQGRNLLGHANAVTYEYSQEFCGLNFFNPEYEVCDPSEYRIEDRFIAGIPTLPLLGLRVTF